VFGLKNAVENDRILTPLFSELYGTTAMPRVPDLRSSGHTRGRLHGRHDAPLIVERAQRAGATQWEAAIGTPVRFGEIGR
jgi:hypothetical protein